MSLLMICGSMEVNIRRKNHSATKYQLFPIEALFHFLVLLFHLIPVYLFMQLCCLGDAILTMISSLRLMAGGRREILYQ